MTPLVTFTAAWVLSIVLAQAVLFNPVICLLCLPATLVIYFGWGHNMQARLAIWGLAGLLLGTMRFQLAQKPFDANHIAHYNDTAQIVVLTGLINAEPVPKISHTDFRITAETLRLENGTLLPVNGWVLVRASPYTPASYGDRIEVIGRLESPPIFEDFDYRRYLSRQQIHTLMPRATLTVLESHQANSLLEILYRFKAHTKALLLEIQPEPQASLLVGILLGIETSIPQALKDAFAATGTSHIVAISGANLTLVATLFAILAKKLLGPRRDFPLTLTALWLYTILVGASAAVVRAATMASLALLARHEQRPIHGPTALAAATFLMSAANPTVLWDVGFQLSLASTAGLIFFTAPLTALFMKITKRRTHTETDQNIPGWLSEAIILTLAAQITTTPILAATFHQISLITLLTNFLIIPLQSAIMVLGGFALLSALLLRPLGQVIGWLAWVPLALTIKIVMGTAKFPQAAISVPNISPAAVWGYYLLLAAGYIWFSQPGTRRMAWLKHLRQLPYWQVMGALIASVLTVTTLQSLPDGKAHIYFLNVDKGNPVLIQTPNGYQIVIDGGADPQQFLSELGDHLPFWDREIDLVILTTASEDQLTGLIALLERYQVVFVVNPAQKGQGDTYKRWEALITARPSETVIHLHAGDDWKIDPEMELRVLWPVHTDTGGPIVLQLIHGETTVLLTSDATTVVEKSLVTQYGETLQSKILHVPRHGSATTCTPEFLQFTAPELAVISTRAGNPAPAPQTLARLQDSQVYRTDKHGTIEIISNGHEFWIQTDTSTP